MWVGGPCLLCSLETLLVLLRFVEFKHVTKKGGLFRGERLLAGHGWRKVVDDTKKVRVEDEMMKLKSTVWWGVMKGLYRAHISGSV